MEGFATYWITRFCFQRALALTYCIGFLIFINQGKALIGANGLLPARLFVREISFWQSPSLFWFQTSDPWLMGGAWLGLVLSLLALTGISDGQGLFLSMF